MLVLRRSIQLSACLSGCLSTMTRTSDLNSTVHRNSCQLPLATIPTPQAPSLLPRRNAGQGQAPHKLPARSSQRVDGPKSRLKHEDEATCVLASNQFGQGSAKTLKHCMTGLRDSLKSLICFSTFSISRCLRLCSWQSGPDIFPTKAAEQGSAP